MSNRWGIPKEVENLVIKRDTSCVYCRAEFRKKEKSPALKATWEHIVNDVRINGIDNIALCCMSCNASKGAMVLQDWLQSDYCRRKGITAKSVAQVVKNAILNQSEMSRFDNPDIPHR